MYFPNILFIVFFLQTFLSYSQTNKKCEEILSKKIEFNITDDVSYKNCLKNFKVFQNCGLNKTDIKVYYSTTLLTKTLFELTKNSKKPTYKELLTKVLEFKKTEQYIKLKRKYQTAENLSNKIANIKNWEIDKQILIELKIPNYLIKSLKSNLEKEANKTYAYHFAEIEKERISLRKKALQKELDILKGSKSIELEKLIKKANIQNKPLLIYFTSNTDVNSVKVNINILTIKEVYNKIKKDFYFVTLYVDDNKKLPKSEWYETKYRKIYTVGQKNADFQSKYFKTPTQPYFVILDKKGNRLKNMSYVNNIDLFLEFLTLN